MEIQESHAVLNLHARCLYGLLCCLFACCSSGQAQLLSFRPYTSKDGLPSNQINGLEQDARGFLWIGTNNGLSSFDGERFRNYTVMDGLSNGWITSIRASSVEPGTLWIGTIAGGVNRLQDGRFTVFQPGSTNDSNNVDVLGIDRQGVVWCANEFSIFRIAHNTLRMFRTFPRGTAPRVAVIDSLVYLPVKDSLLVLTTGGALLHAIPLGLQAGTSVSCLVQSNSGDLFLLGSRQQLTVIRDGVVAMRRTLPDPVVLDLRCDASGDLWYTTPREEYVVLSAKDLAVRFRSAAAAARVYGGRRLYFDREDNLWVATVTRGLLQCRNTASYTFPGEQQVAAVVDDAGHVWTGSVSEAKRPLHEIARDGSGAWLLREYRLPVMSTRTRVYPFLFDRQNRIWLYVWTSEARHEIRSYQLHRDARGVATWTPLLRLRPGIEYPSQSVIGYLVDREDRLWLGSDTCLTVLDAHSGRMLHSYTWKERRARADHLFEDRAGTVWIGTFADGLHCLPSGASGLRKVDDAAGPGSDGVRSFFEDARGRLWIGTRYHGLFVRDGGRFRNITMRDGLLSNTVWRIVPIDTAIMALMTESGIERIRISDLSVLPMKPEWRMEKVGGNVAIPAGLPWYASHTEGLTMFDTPRRNPRRDAPPVYITELERNGTATELRTGCSFSADQNNLTFHFVGISFRDEKSIRYKYRLLGIDEAWSPLRTQRSVAFAALPPGSYQFHVIAVNSDGLESTEAATFAFTIRSPYWRTWWFAALVAGALVLLLAALYRYRMKRLLELERLRTRIASDLHDDVGTNLGSIAIASQLAARKLDSPGESRKHLEDIRATAQRSQELMRDIVWMLDPKNDTLDDFLLKLKEAAGLFLADIPYTFEIEGGERAVLLGMDFKRTVLLIVKEALSNIRTHARASRVAIRVSTLRGEFRLHIEDNGVGISGEATTGSGVRNMRRRAEALGAVLEIRPVAPTGTAIHLAVRIT